MPDSYEEILEPAPGAAPLWAEVRITALFPADAARVDIAAAIEAGLGTPAGNPAFSVVEDRDWDADWRRQLKPLRFGQRLWICPVGQPCPAADGISVILEPGLAGTGAVQPPDDVEEGRLSRTRWSEDDNELAA